ncbi:PEGA domain-containing protein [Corallococcus sp. H22C18031201]|nr:PEGA domain-containing protein [Corallococcus sp. H22C18031201]
MFLALAISLSAPSADAASRTRRSKAAKTSKSTKKPSATKSSAADSSEAFEPPESVTPSEPLAEPAPTTAKTPATSTKTGPAVATPVKTAPEPAAPRVKEAPAPAVASRQVAVFATARQPQAAEAAARLEGELMRMLRSRNDVEFVSLASAFPPAPAMPTPKADALFDEGRSAYDNLDPEAAAAKFKAAATAYTQQPADMRAEKLGETYLMLGASLLLNGDMPGARAAFTHALVAEPTTRPDTALFGQDVQKAFSEAQAELAKQAPGTLTVESVPEGATVLVRGREVGTTPLKGVTLPPGGYPVVVQLAGYTAYATYTEVKASGAADVKSKLEPSPAHSALREAAGRASTAQAFDAKEAAPEVGALAERLGARYVVLAAVSQDKKGRFQSELQAWDLRTKNRLRGLEVELAARDGKHSLTYAADQVHTFLTGPVVPVDSGSTPTASSAVWRKPWFWAAVGGTAAVAAGVVFVATQDKGRGFNPISGMPGGVTF